jgi:hypothetical protein
VENDVFMNSRQSKLLDSLLGVETVALIAVPFYFLGACRGVVSCVQLRPAGVSEAKSAGFRPEHLSAVERSAAVLSRLIEFRVLSQTIGWSMD